jgi:fluoroacetyl-CoA thioesterase
LAEGEGSVGIKLSVTHDAPSAIGSVIIAKATVAAVDGRRVDFEVEAFDGDLVIGKGTHSRFIINNEKFMSKLEKR